MQLAKMFVSTILVIAAPVLSLGSTCPPVEEISKNHYANRWVEAKYKFVEFAVCDFSAQQHVSLLNDVKSWKPRIFSKRMTGSKFLEKKGKVRSWCPSSTMGTETHPSACCGAYKCAGDGELTVFAIFFNGGKDSKMAVAYVHNQLRHKYSRQKKFTCLQENLLREAMALSFEIAATNGKKWKQSLFKPSEHVGKSLKDKISDKAFLQDDYLANGNSSAPPTIRHLSHGMALGPRLIRMTFHDAIDFDNTLNLETNKKVDDPDSKDFGGVDFHLNNAPLSVGLTQEGDDEEIAESGGGNPNHNRGLNNAVKWVIMMDKMQTYLNRPDAMVLGAITSMEVFLDPDGQHKIDFKYGRRQHSGAPYCMDESCFEAQKPPTVLNEPVAEPVGVGMMCPKHNTLGNLAQLLGLSRKHLVALQGAHSVGGIIRCSGLGNTAAGPYCPHQCAPPFKGEGDAEKDILDGSAFDETPSNLDNLYYKQLAALLQMDDLGNTHDPVVPYCRDLINKYPSLGSPQQGKGYSRKKNEGTCAKKQDYFRTNFCIQEECLQACLTSPACQGHDYLEGRNNKFLGEGVSGGEYYTAAFDEKFRDGAEVSEKDAAMDVTKEEFDEWRKECKSCRQKCMPQFASKGELAPQVDPDWCIQMGGRRKCTVDAEKGECPPDKSVFISNYGHGREIFVRNMKKWTYFRGALRRIAILPSDLSNLNDHAAASGPTGDETFAKWVLHYAANPKEWAADFDESFGKIACNGYWDKANGICSLKSCLAVGCTVMPSGQDIECGKESRAGGTDDLGKPLDVVFELETGKLAAGTPCSLQNNVGLRGLFMCGAMEVRAIAKGAKDFAARVLQWNADPTSGTTPACPMAGKETAAAIKEVPAGELAKEGKEVAVAEPKEATVPKDDWEKDFIQDSKFFAVNDSRGLFAMKDAMADLQHEMTKLQDFMGASAKAKPAKHVLREAKMRSDDFVHPAVGGHSVAPTSSEGRPAGGKPLAHHSDKQAKLHDLLFGKEAGKKFLGGLQTHLRM